MIIINNSDNNSTSYNKNKNKFTHNKTRKTHTRHETNYEPSPIFRLFRFIFSRKWCFSDNESFIVTGTWLKQPFCPSWKWIEILSRNIDGYRAHLGHSCCCYFCSCSICIWKSLYHSQHITLSKSSKYVGK